MTSEVASGRQFMRLMVNVVSPGGTVILGPGTVTVTVASDSAVQSGMPPTVFRAYPHIGTNTVVPLGRVTAFVTGAATRLTVAAAPFAAVKPTATTARTTFHRDRVQTESLARI